MARVTPPYMENLDPENFPETDDIPESYEHHDRLPCGCPLDSGCDGYHALDD